jgi:threonine aldolase
VIPLASDTESRPTAAMRAAIAAAEVGDEQKGQDPTVNRLLERVCALLGKEAALFLPSGTMCNLVAIKAHTAPGDVVLVERDAHIARAEAGGAALAAGVQLEAIRWPRGWPVLASHRQPMRRRRRCSASSRPTITAAARSGRWRRCARCPTGRGSWVSRCTSTVRGC